MAHLFPLMSARLGSLPNSDASFLYVCRPDSLVQAPLLCLVGIEDKSQAALPQLSNSRLDQLPLKPSTGLVADTHFWMKMSLMLG